MSKFILQLDNELIVFLSINHYYLNIIQNTQLVYRIDSQQKIIFIKQLSSIFTSNKLIKPTTNNKYLILVNRKFQWTIFCLQKGKEPRVILSGEIPVNKTYDNEKIQQYGVTNIHEVGSSLILIKQNFYIYQIALSQKHNLPKSYLTQLYPCPKNPYLLSQFLPSPINFFITACILIFCNNQTYKLILTFQQKNKSKIQTKSLVTGVCQVLIDWKDRALRAGNDVMLNVRGRVMAIYSIQNNVIVQTTSLIYLWEHHLNQQGQKTRIYDQFKFNSPIVQFQESKTLNKYFYGLSNNQIIKITYSQSKGLLFQQNSHFSHKNEALFYFFNSINPKQSYMFFNDYSLHKVKQLSQKDNLAIARDQSVLIQFAKLSQIKPNINVLYIKKRVGLAQKIVLITNCFVQVNRQQYQHNLPLRFSNLVSFSASQVILSSPIFGSICLSPTLTSSQLTFKSNSTLLPYTSQTLYYSQKLFITAKELFCQHKKQSKNKSKYQKVQMGKLFQGAIGKADLAVGFQNGMVCLTISQQLHVFQTKNWKRKFIHCFNKQIRTLLKLNDVNVIGVELYDNSNDTDMRIYQIYIILDQTLKLLKCISYYPKQQSPSISFPISINTIPHSLTLLHNFILLISSQPTHLYKPQSTTLNIFPFVHPLSQVQSCEVFSIIGMGEKMEEHNLFGLTAKDGKVLVGKVPKKVLVKHVKQININYQSLLLAHQLEQERVLFAINVNQYSPSQKIKKLVFFTQSKVINMLLMSGKIQYTSINPNLQQIYKQKYGETDQKGNKNILAHKGLQTLSPPYAIHAKPSPLSTSPLIISTAYQIWSSFQSSTQIKLHSVYTLLNNQFLDFRNNLSVQELDHKQFMGLFCDKIKVNQVKWVGDLVLALFARQIVVLNVGPDGTFSVRQEIKFQKIKHLNNQQLLGEQQQLQQSQNNLQPSNNYSQIRITHLLSCFSQTNLFLKDIFSRLYRLQLNPTTKLYQIIFDRNLDQDIVCVQRLHSWDKISMDVGLDGRQEQKDQQEIVVKRDGQMHLRNITTKKDTLGYL